jgi:hypothetical protein
MTPLAVFGITNDGLNLAVNLLLLFLVVFWIALVYWTYADARRRIEDPMLVGCATAASLFPFVGTIVYTIIRPPEFLEDVRERQLEIAAAEARLHQIEQHACPYCDYEVEKSFLRCPNCLRRLKEPCTTCGKPLDPRWKICPYCEAEVPHAQAPPPQAQPRRREPPPERRPRERAPAPAADAAPRRAAAAPRPAERPAARPAAKRPADPRPAERRPERPAPESRRPATDRPQASSKRPPPLPTAEQRKAASSRPKPQPKNSNSEQGQAAKPEGDERPSGERARP